MLRISKLADYGTVIMNCLASEPSRLLNANEVSKKVQISLPTVSKLLKMLVSAELITSVRGSRGGYRLARDPGNISLADVITALDGKPALTQCNAQAITCSKDAICAVRDNWRIINKLVLTTLESFTLADMTSSLNFHPLVIEGVKMRKTSIDSIKAETM